MDANHKQLLKGHHSELIELNTRDGVVVYLVKERIISDDEVKAINEQETPEERSTALLALLPRKGKDAFPELLKALRQDGGCKRHSELADLLEPTASSNSAVGGDGSSGGAASPGKLPASTSSGTIDAADSHSWKCFCGRDAVRLLTTNKESPNLGRWFHKCATNECKFWGWEDVILHCLRAASTSARQSQSSGSGSVIASGPGGGGDGLSTGSSSSSSKMATSTSGSESVKPAAAKPTTAKPTAAKPTTAKLTTAKPTADAKKTAVGSDPHLLDSPALASSGSSSSSKKATSTSGSEPIKPAAAKPTPVVSSSNTVVQRRSIDSGKNLPFNLGTCPKCSVGELTLRKDVGGTCYKIGCSNYPECKGVITFPDFVVDVSPAQKKCKCGKMKVELKFVRGKAPEGMDQGYKGCIHGNCDPVMQRNRWTISKIVGGGGRTGKPMGSAMSLTGNEGATSPGTHPAVSSSGAMVAPNPSWQCDCGMPAIRLQVKKDGPTHGRWFHKCAKLEEKCSFWKWEDEHLSDLCTPSA